MKGVGRLLGTREPVKACDKAGHLSSPRTGLPYKTIPRMGEKASGRMLKRVRIEVEGEESAAACSMAFDRYEHALHVAEGDRFQIGGRTTERDWAQDQLGREVTDEVIEFDPSVPGYRGRRVVRYERLDTRTLTARVWSFESNPNDEPTAKAR